MFRFPELLRRCAIVVCGLLLASAITAANSAKPTAYYGYGEPATPQQIAGWDIDIRSDGKGLPPGSGSVQDGEIIYEEQCALCHGSFGEGEGRYPSLAGGEGSLQDARPHKTVGSYWNYTSTLWDYIHRAMPFTQPESLSDDEVYAVTAYVLYLNDLVDGDFVLSQETLTQVQLPNEPNFVPDPRPDVHNKRCMRECKDPNTISIKFEAALHVPTPTKVELPSENTAGESVYRASCAVCHDSGIGGAPVLGDASDWLARIGKDVGTLYSNAINGFQGDRGVMPARGGFTQLSDAEVTAAVDYLVEESR
ncbi:MAG: c-type cytochrome [Halieaceae bacterium]|jgi:S-disulfanyl-L-cysteine oxidoreductase SoxD|nr:c-type cytochrome [Halieaceae bacterium]